MERLAWWWNGNWGTGNRRDVWLERDAEKIYVRWRSWEWRDRDGLYWTTDPTRAVEALKALLGEERTGWRETIYF